ncbi:MAG: WD40 repeat domain-containing protein [Anaerolineae bacterium]|nr:WD40 repeat domain-containing protein [Anaerolineae bacterium]
MSGRHTHYWPACVYAAFLALIMVLLASGAQPIPVVSGKAADPPAGAMLRTGRGTLNALALAPDARHFAVASSTGLAVYDVSSFAEVASLRITSPALSLAYDPHSSRLIAGLEDGSLVFWTGAQAGQIPAHSDRVVAVTVSPDGLWLASAASNGELIVTDLRTFKPIYRQFAWGSGVLNRVALAFSPDGRVLASGWVDGTVILYDRASGARLSTQRAHAGASEAVGWLPDGSAYYSGGSDGSVFIWETQTHRLRRRLNGNPVRSLALAGDGWQLLAGNADGTAMLWDIRTGRSLLALRRDPDEMPGPVLAVTLLKGGAEALSAGRDGQVIRWDTSRRRPLRRLDLYGPALAEAWYAPDGGFVSALDEANRVRTWDAMTGDMLSSEQFRGVLRYPQTPVEAQFGGLTARVVDSGIVIFVPETSQTRLVLTGYQDAVLDVAFSPDGGRLAAACADGMVLVWPLDRPDDPLRLAGHTGPVRSLAWSPDSRALASAANDGTLILWPIP